MNPIGAPPLHELAARHGVQTCYIDNTGREQSASNQSLAAALHALDVPAANDREINSSLHDSTRALWRQGLEPVLVVWEGQELRFQLRHPDRISVNDLRFAIRLESGEIEEPKPVHSRPTQSIRIDGDHFVATEITLPPPPAGYHQLEVRVGRRHWRALIISAPEHSYSEPGARREFGLFLPLYALRSRTNWGAGNFSDWQRLMEWSASVGARVSASLPLHAAFLDHPVCEPSPYSPASRLFWNEFHLDIERIPEFAACTEAQGLVASTPFQNQLRNFRRSRRIDYATQWTSRRRVLEILSEFFFRHPSPRRAQFNRFVLDRPEVEDYAAFRAACDHTRTSWHNWPDRMRAGRLRPGDHTASEKQFHLYVQWLAQEQMNALLAAGDTHGVKLYLDLPLGVNPDGYDVWRERHCFALDASAGAPPDSFFTLGQNWGFAPLHPQRIRTDGYRYVLNYLRFQMRHTGLLRIDHVMGLHRLYWIPRGFSAAQGVYVRYPSDELHALLNLESHRHRTMLVGENLGTVPPEVNERMRRHRLREMFVVQYEQRSDPQSALRNPPPLCVAGINTHDMPTFAAHWRGEDIIDRHKLGLLSKAEVAVERKRRAELKAALKNFLTAHGYLSTNRPGLPAILAAVLKWLSAGDAEIALVTLEDLWLESQPQNVPGTHTERPNWRRKTARTLEEIVGDRPLRNLLQSLQRELKA